MLSTFVCQTVSQTVRQQRTFRLSDIETTTPNYTVSQNKLPPLNCLTLSNRNRFSKFLHCWKAYDICWEIHTTLLISPIQKCFDHRWKNVFLRFLFLSRFYVYNVFLFFRTFFKQKTLKICFLCKLIVRFNFLKSTFLNTRSNCASLNNDRPNCSGLLLLSTFFVSCWAYYMRVGI